MAFLKKYQFTTNNNQVTVTIETVGEYRDTYEKDIDVHYFGGYDKSSETYFEETDNADAIMQWLIDQGLKFASWKSLYFNLHYIQSVMIDGDTTLDALSDRVASMSDEDCRERLEGLLDNVEKAIGGLK